MFLPGICPHTTPIRWWFVWSPEPLLTHRHMVANRVQWKPNDFSPSISFLLSPPFTSLPLTHRLHPSSICLSHLVLCFTMSLSSCFSPTFLSSSRQTIPIECRAPPAQRTSRPGDLNQPSPRERQLNGGRKRGQRLRDNPGHDHPPPEGHPTSFLPRSQTDAQINV